MSKKDIYYFKNEGGNIVKTKRFAAVILVIVASLALVLTGCGGSSSSSTSDSNTNTDGGAHTISGVITGLTTSGLVLQNVCTDYNKTFPIDYLTVPMNSTSFVFATPVDKSVGYTVSIKTQPLGQICTVDFNGYSGFMPSSNVTNVKVNCVVDSKAKYTIGGTVTGLSGAGLELQMNALPGTIVYSTGTISADGPFTIDPLITGSSYTVTVKTQPSGQICSVSNGIGIVANSGVNVTNVAVTCVTLPYFAEQEPNNNTASPQTISIPSYITGTTSGSYLTSTFDIDVYAVTPAATGPVRIILSGYHDTANLDIWLYTAAQNAPIATSMALTGTTETLTWTMTGGTTYFIAVAPEKTNVSTPYNMRVLDLTAGSPMPYSIDVNVSGLSGAAWGVGPVLQNNGADDLVIPGAGMVYTFASQVADGGTYNVTVKTQPLGHTCTVSNGSGTVSGANVTTVNVICTP